MNLPKHWYLLTLLFLVAGMSTVEIYAGLKGFEADTGTQLLWAFSSIFLVCFWVRSDAAENKFESPFELGFLIYILWPITIPWYLIATRGTDGIIMAIGFFSILFVPWLLGSVAYLYIA